MTNAAPKSNNTRNKQIVGDPMIVNGQPLPLSKAVRAHGEFVFISGQLPLSAGKLVGEGDIRAQAKQTLDNVCAIVEAAGASMSDIVKCTIWLTDAADFQPFNETYRDYFESEPPARSCVISQLVVPGAKVEIEAIALLPA